MKQCKNFKKYKALRAPTCGCEACKEKWDATTQKIVLYDGVPKPQLYHVGTAWKKRKTKDRWGVIPAGFIRRFSMELKSQQDYLGPVDVPRSWFGNKTKIHIRIVAEVTKLRQLIRWTG